MRADLEDVSERDDDLDGEPSERPGEIRHDLLWVWHGLVDVELRSSIRVSE